MRDENSERDRPLVSVVIPSYGRPQFLPDAVESVAEQTYDRIELVVVDDCSPRPIEPLLDETSLDGLESFRCIRHDENRGANAARNTGIEASEGEYLAFLDDDDYWLPRKVERQVAVFERSPPDVGLVDTGIKITDGDGNVIGVSNPTVEGDATKPILTGANVGSLSRVMVRADVVESAGGLDERFPSWQDREWYLRLSTHCRFDYVSEPLTVGRVDSHEQISDDFESKRDVTYPLFLEKHRSLAAEYGPICERRFVAVAARSLGVSGLRTGHYREALSYLVISLWYYPFYAKTLLFLLLALGGRFTYRPARWLKTSISSAVRS